MNSSTQYLLFDNNLNLDDQFYESIYDYIVKRFNAKPKPGYLNYIKEFYSDLHIEQKDIMIKDLKIAFSLLSPNRKRDILIDKFKFNISSSDIAKKYGVTYATINDYLRHIISKLLTFIRRNRYTGDIINPARLSTRTYNILMRGRYKSNKDLEGIDYPTFSSLRNAGIKSWEELCAYMNTFNINYVPYTPVTNENSENISPLRKKLLHVLDKYYEENGLPCQEDRDKINEHISSIEAILTK